MRWRQLTAGLSGLGAGEQRRLQEENTRLRRAVDELSLLNELAAAIGAAHNTQQVIEEIVQRCLRTVGAEEVVISLREKTSEDIMKTYIRHKVVDVLQELHLTQGLLALMGSRRSPLLINDVAGDTRLRGLAFERELTSLLCVPLLVQGELIGVLAAYNKKGGAGFTEGDQRILEIIATQSAQMLENARLSEEERALADMRREVELARGIQMDLIPDTPPRLPGYEIAGRTLPAQSVGGDYLDYFMLESGRLALCLGDVSGKGIPASLLMANLQATLRGQSQLHTETHDTVSWANRLLYRSTSPEKFATLFYAVLDPARHELSYCNAGHERPLLLAGAAGREPPRILVEGGLMLGVMSEFEYPSGLVTLAPGDLLVVYSDGVTDALDASGWAFGMDALVARLQEVRGESPEVVVDAVVDAVRAHAAGAAQLDDITLLALRRQP
jgi:sigma-B regulation protein RsbU (phosphoserine phosphatase)